MKKLIMLIAIFLFCNNVIAQDKLYLVFEFMKVDNDQENEYADVETFWEKIHEQRVKNGDILGWDLWSLQPGGEDQGYQYLTVTLFNDPVKMMAGTGGFNTALKNAYPKMSDEALAKKFNETSKARDLAVRLFLERINGTKDDFEVPLGTVASINLMKVAPDNYESYEKAESEIFKPLHQKEVDAGMREHWDLLRIMSPYGSDTYATHITVDMYKNYEQVFSTNNSDTPSMTKDQMQKIQDALTTRDLKYQYMASLIKRVR